MHMKKNHCIVNYCRLRFASHYSAGNPGRLALGAGCPNSVEQGTAISCQCSSTDSTQEKPGARPHWALTSSTPLTTTSVSLTPPSTTPPLQASTPPQPLTPAGLSVTQTQTQAKAQSETQTETQSETQTPTPASSLKPSPPSTPPPEHVTTTPVELLAISDLTVFCWRAVDNDVLEILPYHISVLDGISLVFFAHLYFLLELRSINEAI